MIAKSERYVPAQGVVGRAVGDEMVLLDLRSGTYFTLSTVASTVWSSLEGGHGLDEVVAAVVEEFEIDEATARADVLEFLAAAAESGLVASS
ncbi:MAG: PqqD family protein [Dehalococcoidia bacterium]